MPSKPPTGTARSSPAPRRRASVATEAGERAVQATVPVPRDSATDVVATERRQDEATEDGTPRGHPVTRAAGLPILALRVVAHDLSSAARRPDTVVYWGGLLGLAALGVLDWPVAAVIGVGVAVAGGVRRARG